MAKFIIQGGRPLMGAVRLGGAKNAGFKLMIAAALAENESRLLNLSYIRDVEITRRILLSLGIKAKRCGERTIFISPNYFKSYTISPFLAKQSRSSTLFASLLLAKLKKAAISFPGGCFLGERPIDRHLDALRCLGAVIKYKGDMIYLSTKGLRGCKYRFVKKTHTGTESLIIAAVLAKGETIIENAGLEPEIDDLINFLNQMGAKIKRMPKDKIKITGVKKLKGAIYQVMPDRNEAVSYAIAALATKGDVFLENARAKDLLIFLKKVEEIGGRFAIYPFGIRFWYEKPLLSSRIETQPAPGFMTDWQPLWTLLMTQAEGESRVIERVYPSRFSFVKKLNEMGAKIEFYNPKVRNPQNYYEFNWPEKAFNYHAVKIFGPTKLKAVKASVDNLRSGATLTLAALIAKGTSVINNISHIDRGYEKLDDKLKELGAKIKRI